jgi:hypothetical protein
MTWRVGIRVIAILYSIWPIFVGIALAYSAFDIRLEDAWVDIAVYAGAAALLFVMLCLAVGLWNYSEGARMAATALSLMFSVLFGWVLWDFRSTPDDAWIMLFFASFTAMFLFLRSKPVKEICNELTILKGIANR